MLRAYMQDLITLKFDTGHVWGEPTWWIPDPILAYVEWKSHLVRNLAGEQVVSRAIVYIIYPARTLTHKDRIIINATGIEYAILDLTPGKDFSPNHQEAHIQ
ncbi:hypothetical protein KA005_76505 [bacterium]|nr:hypothetical protein [bacterium]